MKNNSRNNFKNMTIGAIASTIAGAYYLYGSRDGEAKRKQIAAWSLKLKGDVLQGLEKLKEVSEPTYKRVVKEVSARYKKIDKGELKKVVDELNSTWNKMKREVAQEIKKTQEKIEKENGGKSTVKSKKPTVKTATKKVAKKTSTKQKSKKTENNTDNTQEAKDSNGTADVKF